MDSRVPALIERAQNLNQIILNLQSNAAIIHDSNKYRGALVMYLQYFENDETLAAHVKQQQGFKRSYTEQEAIQNFEFRLERAAIAIENYINRGQFNCGYWHPLED